MINFDIYASQQCVLKKGEESHEKVCIIFGTFVSCFCGVAIGKKFGTKLSDKATILGGIILIGIGIEIFLTGVF